MAERHGSERGHEQGIFARMMAGLAAEHGEDKTVIIDATYLKAHQTATSMGVKKGGRGRLIGRTKGGMTTKLHATCDTKVVVSTCSSRQDKSAITSAHGRCSALCQASNGCSEIEDTAPTGSETL